MVFQKNGKLTWGVATNVYLRKMLEKPKRTRNGLQFEKKRFRSRLRAQKVSTLHMFVMKTEAFNQVC